MQNSRRVARELALKVLFQVDVGKQPLEEVIEGALGQIRTSVDGAASQAASEAQIALRSLAAEYLERLKGQVSAQSNRQIKGTATSMATELRSLARKASETAHDLCARPTEGAADRAMASFHEEVGHSLQTIDRIASRHSVYPEVLNNLRSQAEGHVGQLEAMFAKQAPTVELTASFMLRLIHGVTEKKSEIDIRLAERSTGWSLDRQAAVDRNIMRLAAYEILFVPDIPTGASINEAVELAKKYSTAESGRFVNGVLGNLSGAKDHL